MNRAILLLMISCTLFLNLSCQEQQSPILYETESLTIQKISDHCYVHTSYLDTEQWGKVPCNGMVILENAKAIIFDTPTDDRTSTELINWIEKDKKSSIQGVIATHFHIDCLGGLKTFHKRGIRSYSHNSTLILAAQNGFEIPYEGFKYKKSLTLGSSKVELHFLGEGHTKDNIVAWYDKDQVLFGGCLIKSDGSGKGNLDDANEMAWPKTVMQVKSKFSHAKLVVPGHGTTGGPELLDYTIELFTEK